jgi:hypothetical protein
MENSNNKIVFSAKKWHYFSGIILSVFIAFHLFNQLASLIGPATHIEIMKFFRKIYRHPLIESILLLSVISQLFTGIKLLFSKTWKTLVMVEKIQVYSGLYLSFFLIIHVSAVLSGRYIIGLDTNFYYTGVGLNYYPATFFFIPYYFLAVASITLHISAIHYLKTKSLWSSLTIATIGSIVSILIIVGFTDYFHWRIVPLDYQNFIHESF